MTFTKILCPTDFSAGAQQALRAAARIAAQTNAELVIAHAWYVAPPTFSGEFMFPGSVIQEMVDDALRRLAAAVRDATAAGAKHVTSQLVTGIPWSAIEMLLDRQAFDLCVVGTHGGTGLSRILLGSVAEKVVRHSPCSVLAVRPDSEPKPYRNVLVPTDFSPTARRALELAAELVEPQGMITLLHVVDMPTLYAGPVPTGDYSRELGARASAALAEEATRVHTNRTITPRTRFGTPGAQTLAALDDDRSVDLVVIGSHGRTGVKRMILGSVAEKIVRHAHCPVLVARERR